MKAFLKKAVFVVVLCCLGFLIHRTQWVLDKSKRIHFVDTTPVFLPRGEVLKWMSMGYRGIVADWLWIRCVLYYGRRAIDEDNPYYIYMLEKGNPEKEFEAIRTPPESKETPSYPRGDFRSALARRSSLGLVDYIYPMLDRLTTVDPHFVFPYIFGGVYILIGTGEKEDAMDLLKKGYVANPSRWEFPLYLGWIEWWFFENKEKTQEYMLQAVSKKGCPTYVPGLIVSLSRNIGRTEFAKLYLEGMLKSTENPEVRKQIEELLARISEEGS